MQDDLLYESLTLHETLLYTAMLRLPRRLSAREKEARVDVVITALGLESCRNTIIGAPALPVARPVLETAPAFAGRTAAPWAAPLCWWRTCLYELWCRSGKKKKKKKKKNPPRPCRRLLPEGPQRGGAQACLHRA